MFADCEGSGDRLDGCLVEPVKTDHGADADIGVPWYQGAVADGAKAGALSQEEGHPGFVEDLLDLLEDTGGWLSIGRSRRPLIGNAVGD